MYAYELVQQADNRNVIKDAILGENSPFTVAPLHEALSASVAPTDIITYLKSFDLTALFPSHSLNQSFPCHFFSGNLGWISEKDGHYRYFSRNYKGITISFDLIDFLHAYYEKKHIYDIVKLLSNKVGVIRLDKRWREMQRSKYLKNIESNFIETENKDLRRILVQLSEVYRLLNEEGLRHLGPMILSYKQNAMFFSSHRYLGEKLGMSPSKVSRACLMLEALGFINTIPAEYIPGKYLEKSMGYAGRKNIVNYYSIPQISDVNLIINKNFETIQSKSIKFSTITRLSLSK